VRRVTVILLLLAAGGARASQPAAPWRDAPEYLAVFAPAGERRLAYQAFVSPRDLDAVLRDAAADAGRLPAPGAWQPKDQLPFDAFGQTGRYDHWKLARLFGARRARVARGPRGVNGQVTESWTLISPYPDPALTRLLPGTLLIVLKVR
jgi:hypothetical protein